MKRIILTLAALLFAFISIDARQQAGGAGPAIPAGTLVQQSFDTFTRANSASLGTNWFSTNPTPPQIASNTVEPGGTGSIESSFFVGTLAQTWPQDQCAQVTIAAHANNNTYGDVGVRQSIYVAANNAGASVVPGGGYFYGAFNGSGSVQVWRYYQGGAASLATGNALTVGHTYKLCATGQPGPPLGMGAGVTLTYFDNGVQTGSVVDTSANAIPGGAYGILVFATTAVTDIQLTNFSAGAAVNQPTLINPIPVSLIPGQPTTGLGNITASGQAVQFYISPPSRNFLGRLQMAVGTGPGIANVLNSVINPQWTLIGSQDGGTSWFVIPAVALPTGANLGGQPGAAYAQWYDVSGLASGTLFQFILVSGTVNGSLPVYALIG